MSEKHTNTKYVAAIATAAIISANATAHDNATKSHDAPQLKKTEYVADATKRVTPARAAMIDSLQNRNIELFNSAQKKYAARIGKKYALRKFFSAAEIAQINRSLVSHGGAKLGRGSTLMQLDACARFLYPDSAQFANFKNAFYFSRDNEFGEIQMFFAREDLNQLTLAGHDEMMMIHANFAARQLTDKLWNEYLDATGDLMGDIDEIEYTEQTGTFDNPQQRTRALQTLMELRAILARINMQYGYDAQTGRFAPPAVDEFWRENGARGSWVPNFTLPEFRKIRDEYMRNANEISAYYDVARTHQQTKTR